MSGKKRTVLPSLAPRQRQLPVIAKMPKAHSSHAGLFVQSSGGKPIHVRASLGISLGRKSIRTEGFETQMILKIPADAKALHGVVNAAVVARGPHVLGANELRIYLAALGMAVAGIAGRSLGCLCDVGMNTPDITGGALSHQRRVAFGVDSTRKVHPVFARCLPGIASAVSFPHIINLKTTIHAIAEAAGLTAGGKSKSAVIAALRTLTAVTMTAVIEKEDDQGRRLIDEQSQIDMRILTYRMLTIEEPNEAGDGRMDRRVKNAIEISFDPLVTDVLRSAEGARYSLVSLDEVRRLEDVALILHNRLCANIDAGKSLRIGIDRLVGYVYQIPQQPDGGDELAMTLWRAKIRKLRWATRKALGQILALGWDVVQIRRASTKVSEQWYIGRPSGQAGGREISFAAIASAAGQMDDVVIPMDALSLVPASIESGA